MPRAENAIVYVAGFAILAAIVYVAVRGVGGAAQDLTRAGVNVAGGAASGVVRGVSDVIGIPDTDAARCQQAIAAGDSWDASIYCPAGTFLKYFFGSDPALPPPP